MVRSKTALVGAALLFFPLFAEAQGAPPAPQATDLPSWLAILPGARDLLRGVGTDIVWSYHTLRSMAEITAFYRDQFQKSAIRFDVSFDGIGTVIRCSEGKEYCVIQIREADDGAFVKISYSPTAGSTVGVVAPRDSVGEAPRPVSSVPTVPKADSLPGTHQIEYIIEGSAGAAGLTYRNAGGGTEQNDVVLPARISFRTVAGAFAYISAQKKGQEGTVRVGIIVDGILMRQSTSSAPYGIATASGRVVDRKISY